MTDPRMQYINAATEGIMRLAWIATSLVALLGGCQEYNITKPPPTYGAPNPAALDNPIVTDRIVQITTPAVDVLWVVDSSSSMADDQNALATNFPTFMDYFLGSGLDYHIGVVTTDMEDPQQSGKLVSSRTTGEKFITVDTVDPDVVFSEIARVGDRGSGNEQGRAAAYAGLELEAAYNAGFLRDDQTAGVHVIVISDENDHSRDNQITKDEFIDYMNNLRPTDELVTFNSIVNPPGGLFSNMYAGTDYLYLTDGIGGIKYPLADGDWVEVLQQLGIQAAGLKREYFLSHLPVVDTIAVQVTLPDATVIPFTTAEYTYSEARNSITFETYIPTPLSQVYIQYTVLSSVVEEIDAG